MTTVLNLKRLEEQVHCCSPEEAVVNAYALENNLMSQLELGTLNVELIYNEQFVTCGDWTAKYK